MNQNGGYETRGDGRPLNYVEPGERIMRAGPGGDGGAQNGCSAILGAIVLGLLVLPALLSVVL